jgi:hypothetical protein
VAKSDSALGEVVGGQLHGDTVAGQGADAVRVARVDGDGPLVNSACPRGFGYTQICQSTLNPNAVNISLRTSTGASQAVR